MKNKLLSLTAITALFFVYSCGNNENKNEESSEAPQSMVAEESKDDGQGIGKFKNVTLAAIDEKLAEQGKVIFEAKCSACHKTSDKKVVGPGLLGVTERRQPAWVLNMMTNPAVDFYKKLGASIEAEWWDCKMNENEIASYKINN